ncbi:MAG: hypothetical protein QG557_910, partial [Pseudomonadota bacterium]|nr:hypothetical protein [Pseudomonadota bacterium]
GGHDVLSEINNKTRLLGLRERDAGLALILTASICIRRFTLLVTTKK